MLIRVLRTHHTKSALLALLLLASPWAYAEWPDKPVRIIVPYVAGAMGDVVTRLLADDMRARFGQAFIVDNRPGAAGNIGTVAAAQAPADGYTFVVAATNNFVINQFLYKDLGLDPLKAFEPVSVLVDVPSVVFISAAVPAESFQQFVAYTRANRGKLNYASPGTGTTPHLSAELINTEHNLGLTHVAYKGASQAITALLANEVQMYLVGAGLGLPHVKAGKLRAIAVSSRERSPLLPETPTFEEAGLSRVKASNWWGLAGPRGVSKDIIDRLYGAVDAWLAGARTRTQLADLGAVPVGEKPAAMQSRLSQEAAYWQGAVRATAAKP